jgi:choline-sulfatase
MGDYKYTNCALDPEQLFDVANDPHELTDLAADPAHADTLERFRAMAAERWDLDRFDAAIRESQARRWVVYEALRNGDYYPWDFQPLQKASERYMRNHMDLNTVEDIARFPRGE